MVQYPTLSASSVRHLEVVALNPARLLLVLITDSGRVDQRIVELGAAVFPPARGVLTVGGVNRAGAASEEASTQGITIGISAPSEELLGVSADGQLVVWNGTSGAAPIVAGIAAKNASAVTRDYVLDLDADAGAADGPRLGGRRR